MIRRTVSGVPRIKVCSDEGKQDSGKTPIRSSGHAVLLAGLAIGQRAIRGYGIAARHLGWKSYRSGHRMLFAIDGDVGGLVDEANK